MLGQGKPTGLLFDPHVTRDLPLCEHRGQPPARIAQVQQQQIAHGEARELLEQHLPFAFAGAVEGTFIALGPRSRISVLAVSWASCLPAVTS